MAPQKIQQLRAVSLRSASVVWPPSEFFWLARSACATGKWAMLTYSLSIPLGTRIFVIRFHNFLVYPLYYDLFDLFVVVDNFDVDYFIVDNIILRLRLINYINISTGLQLAFLNIFLNCYNIDQTAFIKFYTRQENHLKINKYVVFWGIIFINYEEQFIFPKYKFSENVLCF